jgi:hypothetical protein
LAWSDEDMSNLVWQRLFGSLGPTPDDALVAVLAAFRVGTQVQERYDGEVTQVDGQHAVLEIRARDLPDDSVTGVDFEITLERRDGGWAIGSVRRRELCQPGRGGYPGATCI